MWPFNRRNKATTEVPPEIQEYYHAEQRERVGVAWLLALGTLVVTILLALGLFYGGRWTYRKIANNKPATTAVTQKSDKASEAQNNPSQPTPTPDQKESGKQPSTTRTSNTKADLSADLPNTGPGDVLAIFVITATLGYLVYRYYLIKSIN